MKELGEFFRKERLAKGLSIRDLEQRCGLQGINGIEEGRVYLGWSSVILIADALQLNVGQLKPFAHPRSITKAKRNAALARYYAKGHSMRQTAVAFDIPLENVRRILRDYYPELVRGRGDRTNSARSK